MEGPPKDQHGAGRAATFGWLAEMQAAKRLPRHVVQRAAVVFPGSQAGFERPLAYYLRSLGVVVRPGQAPPGLRAPGGECRGLRESLGEIKGHRGGQQLRPDVAKGLARWSKGTGSGRRRGQRRQCDECIEDVSDTILGKRVACVFKHTSVHIVQNLTCWLWEVNQLLFDATAARNSGHVLAESGRRQP